jgi:hypothetical protein
MIRGWKRIALLFSLFFLVLPSIGAFLPQPIQAAGPKKIFDVVTDPAPTQPVTICDNVDIAGPSALLDDGKPLPADVKAAALDKADCIKDEVTTREATLATAWVNLVYDIQALRGPPPTELAADKSPVNKLYKLNSKGEVVFSTDRTSPSIWWVLVFPPAALLTAYNAIANANDRLKDGGRGDEIWADYKKNQADFDRIFSELYKIENVAKAAGLSDYNAFSIQSDGTVMPILNVAPQSDFDKPGFNVVDPDCADDPTSCLEGTLKGIADKYKHFVPGGDYVKDLEVIAARSSDAATGTDRCGTEPGYHISRLFPYIFCETTLLIMDIGEFLLDMSSSLLLKTSGIPGNDDGASNVFDGVEKDTFLGPVQDKLLDTSGGQLTRTAYNYILGLCNVGVLLLLIVIALANILQVQVNTYSLKKLLPGLIIGLILANMSFFIIRAGLEMSGELSQGLMDQLNKNCDSSSTGSSGSASSGKTPCGYNAYKLAFRQMGSVKQDPNAHLTKTEDGEEQPDTSLVFQQFILNAFLYTAAIFVFILAFLFLLRTFIFFFAAAIAPFAFLGLYFPPLSFMWKRWAALVTSWIFMPLVAYFWIWMGFLWFKAVPPTSGFMTYMMGYFFGIAALYAAMKTPFTLAGEAKQMVNKWNDLGANVGKRYTPYGAGNRAFQQAKKNYAANDALLNTGPAVQNSIARKLGGDALNKGLYKQEMKVAQKKAGQDALEAELKGKALDELVNGKEGLIEKWKKSNNDFLKGLGNALDTRTGKIARTVLKGATLAAINPAALALMLPDMYKGVKGYSGNNAALNWAKGAVDKVEGAGDYLVKTGWATPVSYQGRDAQIKDANRAGKAATSRANKKITEDYNKGVRGDERWEEELQIEGNDKAAERAAGDAKTRASNKQLAKIIRENARPLIARINAAHVAAGIAPPTDLNVHKLMNYKLPAGINDPDLAGEIDGFKKGSKQMYKTTTKHLSTTQKSDMDDNFKKEVAETAFANEEEEDKAARLMHGLAPDPNGEGKFNIPGAAPGDPNWLEATEITDLNARIGGHVKTMAAGNTDDKMPEAWAAYTEIRNVVDRMPAGALKTQYTTDLDDFYTSPRTTKPELQAAVKAFKNSAVYKDSLARVTGPHADYRP